MTTVERALGNPLEQLEGWHHGTSGQHLDLQAAARHVVDLLGKVVRVLVEDVLGRPRALEPERGRLGVGHHGHRHGARCKCCAFEQAAAWGGWLGHLCVSPVNRQWFGRIARSALWTGFKSIVRIALSRTRAWSGGCRVFTDPVGTRVLPRCRMLRALRLHGSLRGAISASVPTTTGEDEHHATPQIL